MDRPQGHERRPVRLRSLSLSLSRLPPTSSPVCRPLLTAVRPPPIRYVENEFFGNMGRYFAVFDGHAGTTCVEYVVRCLANNILGGFSYTPTAEDLESQKNVRGKALHSVQRKMPSPSPSASFSNMLISPFQNLHRSCTSHGATWPRWKKCSRHHRITKSSSACVTCCRYREVVAAV